jgi:nitrate reductase NapE component
VDVGIRPSVFTERRAMPPPTAVLALLKNRYVYTFLLAVMLFALLASGLRWWMKPHTLNVAAAAPALSVASILGAGFITFLWSRYTQPPDPPADDDAHDNA